MRDHGWRAGILSGDDPVVVAAVGSRLGLDPRDCLGGVSPEAKLRVVRDGAAAGFVVMVGDGVNDAAADVFITRPGVARVADLLDGAGRAMKTVRRNLVLSLCYNAAVVALAMAGLISPLVAAVLMPLSSITVIASSYRARSFSHAGGTPCR